MSHKSERHLGVPLPCMAVSLGRRWRRQQRWLACVGAPARVAKAHAIALELDEAVVVARLVVADAAAVGEDLHTRVLCRRRELLQARRRRRHRADPCRQHRHHHGKDEEHCFVVGSHGHDRPVW
uniref:Uncharacterized protein n=1 Tax=Zea mays TaxID=4577 RepID=C4IZ72_MAIZE|nr:unknown [Zea mays]